MFPGLAKTLYSGALVAESGLYRVSHSAGHQADTECFLVEGLILPRCSVDRCFVSFTVIRTGPYLVREADFSENEA